MITMSAKKKNFSKLVKEIKQRMRESGLVRKFIYFHIASGFLFYVLLVLFLFNILAIKLDFFSSMALAIIIPLVLIAINFVTFFIYRNPRAKRNWIITTIWNFLDGKHLKYGIVHDIIGVIFVIIFAIFIFFLYTMGVFKNSNEQSILLVIILFIVGGLILGVINLIFLLKRRREVENL